MSTKRKRGGGSGEPKEEDPLLELKLSNEPRRPDPWVIKKTLTKSDLGRLSRLILPGAQVVKHVLPSLSHEQLEKMSGNGSLKLNVLDSDTGTKCSLSFKQWRSSGSYKLGLNWNSEFVKRRQLLKGDEIGMSWDNSVGGFRFSVTGRAAPPSLPLPLPSRCECAHHCLCLRLCQPMPMPQDMIM